MARPRLGSELDRREVHRAQIGVLLGWGLPRSLARAIGPALYRRLEPGTAGTLGFLVRLLTIVAALIVALRIAGLKPATLAVGGAFTAIVLGIAAQQTIGNLFAGLVLLTARPFRVGERMMLQGGALAGASCRGSSARSGSTAPP